MYYIATKIQRQYAANKRRKASGARRARANIGIGGESWKKATHEQRKKLLKILKDDILAARKDLHAARKDRREAERERRKAYEERRKAARLRRKLASERRAEASKRRISHKKKNNKK